MTPLEKIKNTIYRLNNLYMIAFICFIAFLDIINIPKILIISISILFLIKYIMVMKNIRKNTFFIYTLFPKNMYESMILNWLKSYINSSSTILEKKYKLMFLGFAINSKGIKKFTRILDFIKDSYAEIRINENLIAKLNSYQNEEDYFLSRESKETVKNINLTNHKDKEILTILYKDFSNLGLLGLFLNQFDTPAFLILNQLQENMLTENDRINIRKTIPQLKKIEFDMNSDMDLISKISKIDVLENFILNDKDINNMNLYQDFCTVMFKTKTNVKQDMLNLIHNKSI